MIQKTKIFFFGTPEIAVPSLETLAKNPNVEIVGVGVFPDRKVGRKQILTPCAVKKSAIELDLKVFEISNKSDLIDIFETQDFDLGIVIAFGFLFPESILNKTELGVVNVHFSLLPFYRGASPVQSSILNGDEFSGITFQKMVKKLDAGDILFQKKYEIKNKKTSEVFEEFAQKTAENFDEFILKYATQPNENKIIPQAQDITKATFCGKFQKSDGEIFPEKQTAQEIYHQFLALDMWPGIFINTSFLSEKVNLKILDISLEKTDEELEKNKDQLKIICKDDTFFFINKLQIPGKKPQESPVILNAYSDILSDYR